MIQNVILVGLMCQYLSSVQTIALGLHGGSGCAIQFIQLISFKPLLTLAGKFFFFLSFLGFAVTIVLLPILIGLISVFVRLPLLLTADV
jgi:hypothetical protein